MPSRIPTTLPTAGVPEDSNFKDSPLEHVRTLFVAFLQGLFYASPPGAYHWSPDEDLTEIYISNEGVADSRNIGQRPAITTTRGPIQFYSLGLDDMLTYDMRTGQKKKSVLVPGTISLNCCSRKALESEAIAWICAEQLWLHRELLMANGFFEIGRQPAIGAPTPAGSIIANDSGEEWYATTVTCPYQFSRTSQTTPLNKEIVNSISMHLRAALIPVDQRGPISSGGVDPPISLEGYRPPAFAPRASDAYGNTPRVGATAPVVVTVPHPLNPAQRVVMRSSRPNGPAVKPPAMGGRRIPLSGSRVEESAGQVEIQVSATRTVKV